MTHFTYKYIQLPIIVRTYYELY